MMRQYELVERVLAYEPGADEALLNRAYVYAMKAHSNQRRASGDPYFSHPLEVAAILTDLKLDDATIATALLHDVIEDTETTRAEIDQLFGPEIGQLVEGLTKIKRLDLVSRRAEQAENFRKLLIAIASDIRVLLVKLADRLHNMRTLEHMKPASRARISEETLDIYAPLAGRMGMQGLREELEDHAFRWLHPEAYTTLSSRLVKLRERSGGAVDQIHAVLSEKLAAAGIAAEVSGREKKPYAIWRKMQNKQISLEQLSDIYGFRVLVASIDDCYRVLGLAHTLWRMVPGRFKDYISLPKQNGYRSVHTTIVGPSHQRVELQIRTRHMHDVAEYGVAAHALYKDGLGPHRPGGEGERASGPEVDANPEATPYAWLRRLVETLLEGNNPEEFLEHTKLELFHDQVFCFTPKGRLIALPRGASTIDFAYAVHTDVGNRASGALVNGRQLPLSTVLRNGDEVQVITDPAAQPQPAWERLAVTGRARAAIRRATRDAARAQFVRDGRRLIEDRGQRRGLVIGDESLRAAVPKLGHKSLEDMLVALARNELDPEDTLRAIAPDERAPLARPIVHRPRNRFDHASGQDGWFNLAKSIGLKFRLTGNGADSGARPGAAVPIRGISGDVDVVIEPGAVPGDRIVGVLVPGDGIHVFPIHSPSLDKLQGGNWVDVSWDIDPDHPQRFPAKLMIAARNEPGSLAQIAQVMADADCNIDSLHMVRREADFTQMVFVVEVWDVDHMKRILDGLRSRPVVSTVERTYD